MDVRKTKLKLKRPRTGESKEELKKKKIVFEEATKAEKVFKKHWDQKFSCEIHDKIKKKHRDVVEKFNKDLTKMPEHYDIPRVGPG